MPTVSDKSFEEFKLLMEKHGQIYPSDEEARAAANNLLDLMEILLRVDREDQRRGERLKTEPQGFPVESENRNCPFCMNYTNQSLWYDKYGLKCIDCQNALRKKQVPGYIFKDHKNEKHITADTLSWRYGVSKKLINGLVKRGEIRVRTIDHEGKQSTKVILRKDNPNLVSIVNSSI